LVVRLTTGAISVQCWVAGGISVRVDTAAETGWVGRGEATELWQVRAFAHEYQAGGRVVGRAGEPDRFESVPPSRARDAPGTCFSTPGAGAIESSHWGAQVIDGKQTCAAVAVNTGCLDGAKERITPEDSISFTVIGG